MTTITLDERTLHLVDLENLVGDPIADAPTTRAALERYRDLSGWRDGDHVIVAANPRLLAHVMFDPPFPCSGHAVRGTDAADHMLLSHAAPDFVASRYDRLVIGSGDHEFAARAGAVQARGVPVVVVSRRDSLSRALTGHGYGIRLLEPTDDVALCA
jgi:hypothetical protein